MINEYEFERAEVELKELVEIAEDIDANVHRLRNEKSKFFASLIIFFVIFITALYMFVAFNTEKSTLTPIIIGGFVGFISVLIPIFTRLRSLNWELQRESSVLRTLIDLIDNRKKILASKRDRAYINPSIEIRIKRIDFSAGNNW